MKSTVLITGGIRGIGYGIAEQFARAGYRLALCATRPQSACRPALDNLKKLGAAAVLYCRCDISSSEERKIMLQKILSEYGGINILINNAGVAPLERLDLLEATEESYERVMRINVQGPYFLTQEVANIMIDAGIKSSSALGKIIFITSISAVASSVNRGEYCLSKAALSMAAKLWAVRLSEFDIPVYELRPGIIATDMTSGVKEKYDNLLADGLALQKRWGKPEDVGRAALMLAENKLPYSTGQIINIDGGLMVERI